MTVEEILTFKNDSFNKPRYIKPNNITDYKTDEECPKDVFKKLREILLNLFCFKFVSNPSYSNN